MVRGALRRAALLTMRSGGFRFSDAVVIVSRCASPDARWAYSAGPLCMGAIRLRFVPYPELIPADCIAALSPYHLSGIPAIRQMHPRIIRQSTSAICRPDFLD